jgi:hypothetical protein
MVAWKAIRRFVSEKSRDLGQRQPRIVDEDDHEHRPSNSDVPLRSAESQLEDSSGLPVRGQVKWFSARRAAGERSSAGG